MESLDLQLWMSVGTVNPGVTALACGLKQNSEVEVRLERFHGPKSTISAPEPERGSLTCSGPVLTEVLRVTDPRSTRGIHGVPPLQGGGIGGGP